jgi:probable addiction module antidote protein
MTSGTKKSKPFDAARYLDSDEAIAAYITEALGTLNLEMVTHAIGVAAKAKGMTKIAEETGLSRESLYKALSGDGNPEFDTILRVVEALGLQLRAEPSSNKKRAA